jgi:hypothetical protein
MADSCRLSDSFSDTCLALVHLSAADVNDAVALAAGRLPLVEEVLRPSCEA